jgi:hypothetical protein
MRRFLGLALASAIVLGMASVGHAQVVISSGGPAFGGGIVTGAPLVGGGVVTGAPLAGGGVVVGSSGLYRPYASPYVATSGIYSSPYANASIYQPVYGPTTGTVVYSSGYSGYVAPGTTYMSTGYYGPSPVGAVVPYPGYGYISAPYYGGMPYYGWRGGFGRGRWGWW